MLNLGGSEIIVISVLMFVVIGIPYSFGYYSGLSKGRRESLKPQNWLNHT